MDETLEQYLKVYTTNAPTYSANDTLFFSYDKSGVGQLWKVDKKLEQVSFYDNFILSILGNPVKEQIFFTMSAGGNEEGQIYRFENNQTVCLTQQGTHHLGAVDKTGNNLFFTSNSRNKAHFDIEVMNLETLDRTIILENNDNYNFIDSVSKDNNYIVYRKLISQDNQPLWLLNLKTKETYNFNPIEGYYSHSCWDESGFYFISNFESEFIQLYYYDINTKEISLVKKYNYDIENISISNCGKYLSIIINEGGIANLKILDIPNTFDELEVPPLPKGQIAFYDKLSWAHHKPELAFTFSSGANAPNIWTLDIDTMTVHIVTDNDFSETIKNKCVDPVLKSFNSFDGLEVPYWVFLPKDKIKGPLPILIHIHGGPEAQKKSNYDGLIQYIVGNGIGVVAPNVRGSTGYGKTYSHLDDKEKRLDSVKDIEYLVKDIVDKGIADKHKIGVYGGSYGGFMTLSCASRYPELFCACIDNVGMYNLVTFLENTADYRRKHRESEYGSLETDRDMLYNVSPVSMVDKIKGPLMVIHGKNDPRVPVSEAIDVVNYLQDKNIEVDFLCYEDEGHGLHKFKNKLDCYEKIKDFLFKHMDIRRSV